MNSRFFINNYDVTINCYFKEATCCSDCLYVVQIVHMLFRLFTCCSDCLYVVQIVHMLFRLFTCCSDCLFVVQIVYMLFILLICCSDCLYVVLLYIHKPMDHHLYVFSCKFSVLLNMRILRTHIFSKSLLFLHFTMTGENKKSTGQIS